MPHHPPASPASPSSPAAKTFGATTAAPLVGSPPRVIGHETGLRVGTVLTIIPGVWSGLAPITLTYQWQRDGANIAGATATTYTLVAADVPGHKISCIETGTNGQGSGTASTSNWYS